LNNNKRNLQRKPKKPEMLPIRQQLIRERNFMPKKMQSEHKEKLRRMKREDSKRRPLISRRKKMKPNTNS